MTTQTEAEINVKVEVGSAMHNCTRQALNAVQYAETGGRLGWQWVDECLADMAESIGRARHACAEQRAREESQP